VPAIAALSIHIAIHSRPRLVHYAFAAVAHASFWQCCTAIPDTWLHFPNWSTLLLQSYSCSDSEPSESWFLADACSLFHFANHCTLLIEHCTPPSFLFVHFVAISDYSHTTQTMLESKSW
jgi:hypothetical protein